jgi:hypothetical protein
MSLQTKLILGLIGAITLMIVGFFIIQASHDKQIIALNNEAAALVPLQRVNDSLSFRIARMVPSEELARQIAANSQLKKAIMGANQKILMLADASMESRAESIYVPVYLRKEGVIYFQKEDLWFFIRGAADSTEVFIEQLRMHDSITVAITRSENGLLYGYLQNHSPYTYLVNANFAVAWQPGTSWFRFDGIGVLGGLQAGYKPYVGLDVRATFWDRLSIAPRYTTQGAGIVIRARADFW